MGWEERQAALEGRDTATRLQNIRKVPGYENITSLEQLYELPQYQNLTPAQISYGRTSVTSGPGNVTYIPNRLRVGRDIPGFGAYDPNTVLGAITDPGTFGRVNVYGTQEMSAKTPAELEQQIRQQWGGYGDWNVKGVNRAKELADLLYLHGVTSLGDISTVVTETPWTQAGGWTTVGSGDSEDRQWVDPSTGVDRRTQLKIGDKTLGFLGDYNLNDTFGANANQYLQDNSRVGWSARGEGNVSYNLRQDPRTGKYYIAPDWATSSDAADILPLAQMALMVFPGAGQALGAALGAGTGLAGQMLGNALIGGGMSALGGGDFLRGAVSAGLAPLAGQMVAPIAGQLGSAITGATGFETLGNMASGALTGAAKSGLGALINDRDFSDALLSGAIGGGVSSGIGSLVNEYAGDAPDFLKNLGTKYLSNQLTSEILGGGGGRAGGGARGYGSAAGTPGAGSSGAGGADDGSLLSMMFALGMMGQQNTPEPQQTPQNYAGTVKSPFGSILG